MNRPARLATALLLTASLTGATAGCSSTDAAPVATRAAVTTPSSTPTPVVVTKAYTMADGSVVDVDPTVPLPANVLADITAVSQAIVDSVPGVAPKTPDEDMSGFTQNAVGTKARDASVETGREVIIIYRVFAVAPTPTHDGTWEWIWVANRGAEQAGIADKATRVAEVQAFIAAQDNPAAWDLIVLD